MQIDPEGSATLQKGFENQLREIREQRQAIENPLFGNQF